MDEDARVTRLKIVTQMVMLGYALWMLWTLIPEDKKRRAAMAAMAGIRSCADRTAFRTGHQAMAQELRSGTENYELPYLCSRVRDKAACVYEGMRYS